MIENIFGWSLILLIPVLVVYTALKLRRRLEKIKQDRIEAAQRLADERAKEARAREKQRQAEKAEWQARLDGASHVGRTQYDYNTDRTRTTVKERETGRQVSYVHTNNDGGPDILTTMIVADMLLNHKESSAGTVSWKDDVPTVRETHSTPSFGLDDDDSRKSVSSSFSFSDSSDSSSSSSDSGPSSDW